MKRSEDLIVITKTYDPILWSCQHTSWFPRNHRFVLGKRIEQKLYDLLELLIAAKYTPDRQPLLERANLALEVLRFQLPLAKFAAFAAGCGRCSSSTPRDCSPPTTSGGA